MPKKTKKSGTKHTQRATVRTPAADVGAEAEATAAAAAASRARRTRVLKGVGVAVAALAVVAVVLVALLLNNVIGLPGAAARYDGWNIISEDEVTDYIESYRAQQGYEGSTDEEWAEFLESVDMTPESLREATVQQFVTEDLIIQVADGLGLGVTTDELDETIELIKEAYALGDDEIFEETVEAQGVTMEEFEEILTFSLLEDKVFDAEVEYPTATDDEALTYAQAYYSDGTTTKHVYCFKMLVGDDDSILDVQWDVNQVLTEFFAMGYSVENFTTLLEEYCDDEELLATGGSVGYDIDTDGWSDEFTAAVDDLGEGGVSEVFADDDGYAFVYVDEVYALPSYSEGYEFPDLPDELGEYFRDCMSEILWEEDCNSYLLELYESVEVVVYSMPSGLSYDVEM